MGSYAGEILVIVMLIKIHYIGIILASAPDITLNVTNQESNNTRLSRNSTGIDLQDLGIFTATNSSETGENITGLNVPGCPQNESTVAEFPFEEYVSVSVAAISATVCLGVWAVVANGLPLVAIIKHEQLNTPVYILMANLAASDVTTGIAFVLVGSSVLYYYLTGIVVSFTISRLFLSTLLLSAMSSAYSLMALTVERYWFIVHGMTYVNNVDNSKCKVVAVVVWVWSLLLAMLPNFGFQCEPCVVVGADEPCLPLGGGLSYDYVVVILIFVFIPMAAIVLFNVEILRCLWKHVNAIAAQEATVGAQSSTSRRSAFTVVLITAVFLVGWMPIFVRMAMFTQDVALLHHTQVFVILNSAINPMIYAFRLREVRRGVVRLFVNSSGGGNAVQPTGLRTSQQIRQPTNRITNQSTIQLTRQQTRQQISQIANHPNSQPPRKSTNQAAI
ncbi:melanocortin receptor 5-like [Branchiostoma floridae x Branchiostoma belcheri]